MPFSTPGAVPAGGDTAATARQSVKELTTAAGDVELGFVGAFDDAEYMHLIASIGASPGPFRRERRATSKRMVSEMYSPPRVIRAISSMPGCDLIP